MKKLLFIGLLWSQVEARDTFGYYNFDTEIDKVNREYNEKKNLENISIYLSNNDKTIDFILESKYEENGRIALYSGFPGELIIEESCCGRDKRYYLDYYLYNEDYNNFILYKHLESNGILKENENHIDLLNDEDIIVTFSNIPRGINGEKYNHIKLIKPNRLKAKKELKRLSLVFKNKQKKYVVTNLFYFYSILNLYPIEKTNLTTYNNIAYYLQKAGSNKEAVYLLEKIITKYPNRTVAYYNLGDAYWALGDKQKAKEAYTTYTEQMCDAGKQKRIPKVVIDRITGK